jgi:hypothetical protein
VSKSTAATLLWRFLSGHTMSGKYITNATWTMPSRGDHPVIGHPTGHAVRWHHLPRLHRAGIRTGSTAAVLAVAYGLAAAFWLTVAVLAGCAAAAAAYATRWLCRRIPRWRHRRRYVRPLRRALTPVLGAPPVRLEIEPDRSRVVIGVPVEFTGSEREREAITRAVTAKLSLDAPDPKWELHARRPQITFTQSEPPPFPVSWENVAAAVQRAAPKELVFGLGKRGVVSKASYGDSPHLCIPGGSGGGKSNLAAFLLLQELMRGTLIINLDPKWISHLWLQDLPNVINALEVEDLHLALCWLGKELKRRTRAAYYSAEGTGRVRGSVGSRIVVLAEELNYGMPDLKDLHAERRAQDKSLPKKSPAIAALSALSCAGRASDIHMWLVAQLLTVESTGVRDSTIRTNAGIKAMIARLDKPGWDMAVGKHVPMPSPSTIPGRIHLVTGGEPPRETQVPYLHLDDEDEAVAEEAVRWARAMAVSGAVAQIPSGPQGVPPQLWPASVRRRGDYLALEAGQGAETVGHRTDMPVLMSLRQACAEEILRLGSKDPLGAARRAAQRPGFPEKQGWNGSEALYSKAELTQWQDRKLR